MKLSTILLLLFALALLACVPKTEQEEQPATTDPEPAAPAAPADALMNAIFESARLLGVPEQHIRVTESGSETLARLPHSGDEMELTLAGSVLQGQIELAGGKIVSSKLTGNSWVVVARYPDGKRRLRVTLGGGTPLAVIVDDFGVISGAQLQDFCRCVDPAVTFAILPGTPHAQEAMRLGHDTGHELMIHMPMQAMGENPSASDNQLTVGMPATEIRSRVQGWVDELPLCVGANNHQGSAFTSSAPDMVPVMEVLRDNGLYFIDSRTYKDSQAYAIAMRLGVPAAERRCFLDVPGITAADLDAKLEELRKLRRGGHSIVAISHCFPAAKLDFLLRFLERAQAEGFELAPASQVVATPLP
ncbi:MAG: divergent polysaccharide deacetylase family protein [Candidatus Cloacimonetes bacterium]|nr:divergent polysaccharide deacetylase family protein [Candidatus Cloacimonadota bacterium]